MSESPKALTIGDLVHNKSRRFDFNKFSDVVFINTGDVQNGKFLHHSKQSKIGLPGQAKKAIKKGDILYSEIRPENKRFALVKDDYEDHVVSTKFMVLEKISNEIELDYLFLILSSKPYIDNFQRIAESRSGTFPQITFDSISHLPIKVPSTVDQKAIAKILGDLDDKIELNHKMNETLEQMAQALFRSWFVDFDPVIDNALDQENDLPEELRAREEKRKSAPDHLKLINTNPDLAKHFPSSFEYSEELDKWVPKEWKAKCIDDISTVVGGGTPSTKNEEYYTNDGIAWLSPKDLSGYNWKFISKGATDITELGLKKSSAKLMPKGTVLFSSRAPIGYIAIADNEICTNQGFKSLVPDKGVPSEFLYQTLKFNLERIEAVASGSTFKEVSGSALKGIEVLVASEVLVSEFEILTKTNNTKSKIIQQQTQTLTELRDRLLPQLISGRVGVANKSAS